MRVRSATPSPVVASPEQGNRGVTGSKQAHDEFVSSAPAKKTALVSPLPPSGANKAYDGALLGSDGKMYPAGTPAEEVPSYKPKNGSSTGLAIFVNGVGNSPKMSAAQAQQFADGTGAEVVSLYNASEGFWRDALQTIEDKFDLGNNPAVISMANLVSSRLKAGEPVHLIAHSQGALITSRALQDVKEQLIASGMTTAQAEAALSSTLR